MKDAFVIAVGTMLLCLGAIVYAALTMALHVMYVNRRRK